MRAFLLLFLSLFSFSMLVAQGEKTCYQQVFMEKKAEQDSQYQEAYKQFQAQIPALAKNNFKRNNGLVFSIPVVIHIVHPDSDALGEGKNLGEERIFNQLAISNLDFRHKNLNASQGPTDFLDDAADIGIEFCLTTLDPQGNLHTGILRHSFNDPIDDIETIENIIKPAFVWDTKRFLNIWVLDIPPDINGNPIIGYAPLPTPAVVGNVQDGLVIDYRYFGTNPPYSEGRTLSHELGHYLGLLHPWGQGSCFTDDGILDTPISEAPNYGCPENPFSCESSDMYNNFMEYVDDDCMNLFTKGQANVMRSFFNGRSEILGMPSRIGLLEQAAISCAQSESEAIKCTVLNAEDYKMGFEDDELHSYWISENTNQDFNLSGLPNTWNVSSILNQDWGAHTGRSFGLYFWNDDQDSPADDWFFSPCLRLKGGRSYALSYWYAIGAATGISHREKLEVGLFSQAHSDSLQFIVQDLGIILNAFPSYKEAQATFSLANDGDYHLGFHAYSDADEYALVLDDISIKSLETEEVYNVYIHPNLSTGPLEIIIQAEQISLENTELRVYDMQGRLLLKDDIPALSYQRLYYDFSNFSNGLYLIELRSPERTFSSRIMKID